MTSFLDISKVEHDGNNDINQGENHYNPRKDLLLWGKVVNTLYVYGFSPVTFSQYICLIDLFLTSSLSGTVASSFLSS